MSAITPYIGALARRTVITPLSNPSVRQALFQTAGHLGRMAYTRAQRYAGKKIVRAWRNRRGRSGYRKAKRRRVNNIKKSNIGRRATRRIGDPISSSNCKTVIVKNQDLTARASRTLWITSLTTLERGDEEDQRERQIIQLRGFKIINQFNTNINTDGLFCNMAIVTRKDCDNSVSAQRFFRSFGDKRSMDFDTNLSATEMHLSAINTDQYLVHYHKRFKLGPSDNTPFMNITSKKVFKKYIKVNRQLRYMDQPDGNDTEPINTNVFLVWWVTKMDDGFGATTTADAVKHSVTAVMYYREPRA